MPAKVQVAGYEAWCLQCGDGSGITDKRDALQWANEHNERAHPKKAT